MIDLNYHHLYYFYVVASEGSISKACEKLYLAQPTISAQLKQLEESLKLRLFDREGRGLTLTPQGRVVLRYAESIFRLGSELAESARGGNVLESRSLRLGAVAGLPRALVHSAIAHALRLRPGAKVACAAADYGDNVDVLLADAASPAEGYESRLVGRMPVLFVGKAGGPLIVPAAPAGLNRQLRAVQAESMLEAPDTEVAWRLAASGHGFTALDVLSYAANRKELDIIGRGKKTGLFLDVYLIAPKRALIANELASELLRTWRLPDQRRP